MAKLTDLIAGTKPEKKTPGFSVIMVHYSKLIPSAANKYSTDSIQELANMIQLSGGVKQNLLGRKVTTDTYELIAGHRRRLAVKYLVEELGLEQYAWVPLHEEKEGDILSRLDLILTNCGARDKKGWEKLMEVNELTDLLLALQTGSEQEQERFRRTFKREPGLNSRELRKLIAETLGISETQVANMNHINSSLSPELKEQFREGKIGVSVANKAAALPPEKQKELSEQPEIRLADVEQKSVSESDTASEAEVEKESLCVYDMDLNCPVLAECDEVCCEDCGKECMRRCPVTKRPDLKQEGTAPERVSDSDTTPPMGKQGFPDLQNDNQRKVWLERFHDWNVWFDVPQASEVYYRYDLPDGSSLVICEYQYYLPWREGSSDGPDCTGTREYILYPGYHYLADCSSNRTAMVEKLKKIRKGKADD